DLLEHLARPLLVVLLQLEPAAARNRRPQRGGGAQLREPGQGIGGDGEDGAAHRVAAHHLAAVEGAQHRVHLAPGAQGEGGHHAGHVLPLVSAEGPRRLGRVAEAGRARQALRVDPGTGEVSLRHGPRVLATVRVRQGSIERLIPFGGGVHSVGSTRSRARHTSATSGLRQKEAQCPPPRPPAPGTAAATPPRPPAGTSPTPLRPPTARTVTPAPSAPSADSPSGSPPSSPGAAPPGRSSPSRSSCCWP